MSEGADAPMISSIAEGQYLEVIKPLIVNTGENGIIDYNSDGNSSPESETSFHEEEHLSEEDLQQSQTDESFGANNDDEESMSGTISSGSSASMEDADTFDGERSSGHWISGWKMVGDKEVFFDVDYVIYESIYSTNCQLTFSEGILEARGVVAYDDRDDFCIQLRLDDIVSIESFWAGRFQTAKVKIYAPSVNVEAETGTKKLEFAVVDPLWDEKCEAIRSLDLRYNAIWKVANDTRIEEYGDNLGQLALTFQTSYFPKFRPFEDFIYPEGDADAVSISKRDVDLLQPDTFVNDTIIDFYIKYLKDKLQPEKRQRFHFFNSFFFRKLADLEKYPPGSSFDGRAAFLRVRKWTRKVNLFEKDFIFIPVNHNYHWSLLVICHPGDVANFRDEDATKLARVPCILHMDSIRGTHGDLKNRIQSYLCEEWKERQKETYEDISLKFSNLRFVSLELPQQHNSYDCGLFLLHYVEEFLEEDPVSVSPFKITPLMQFLTADWFPSSEPSLKRREIQKLIYDLLENHCQETSPTTSDNKCHPLDQSEAASAMVFPSQSPSRQCEVNLLPSRVDNGIGMNLFPTPLVGSHCAYETGMRSMELFDSNAATGSSENMQYQAFERMSSFNEFKSALASMEDGVGSIENIAYSASKEKFHLEEVTPETRDYACSFGDVRTEASWNQGNSVHQNSCPDRLASLAVNSEFYSDNSLEVRQNEECLVAVEMSGAEKMDLITHVPAGNLQSDCFAPVSNEILDVADPHYSKVTTHQDDNLNQDDTSHALNECPAGLRDLLKRGIECLAGTACNDAAAALELDKPEVNHAEKRQRFAPSGEEEHAITQPEDLCL